MRMLDSRRHHLFSQLSIRGKSKSAYGLAELTDRYYIFNHLVYAVHLSVFYIYGNNMLFVPVILYFVMSPVAVYFLDKSMPPSVLYLACSGRHADEFLARFDRTARLRQLRVISLLKHEDERMNPFSWSGVHIYFNSMRLRDELFNWEQAVFLLMQVAPIIIVDLRSHSNQLAIETRMVDELNLWHKAFVIVESGREEHSGYQHQHGIAEVRGRLIAETTLIELLTRTVNAAGNAREFKFGNIAKVYAGGLNRNAS